MSSIIGITFGLALLVGVIWCAVRFRVRRSEKKPFDLIDFSIIGLIPIGIIAALIIPMLNR